MNTKASERGDFVSRNSNFFCYYLLFLSFSTSGLNEWCGDTWLAWWNQPLSNTKTRCPCNRMPKESAGILHGLQKCLSQMILWQPPLQKFQDYDHGLWRTEPSSKPSGCKAGALLAFIQLLLCQKRWGVFACVSAKKPKPVFFYSPLFTNGVNYTKIKYFFKTTICPLSYW